MKSRTAGTSKRRTRATSKKTIHKTGGRSSRRLLTKAIRERRIVGRVFNVERCATRTVELPSTNVTGDEKHKLLFALALGLIPKYDKKVGPSPTVRMEILDPDVIARARATTEGRVAEIIKKNSSELESRAAPKQIPKCVSKTVEHRPLKLLNYVESKTSQREQLEVIDLVSDNEEEVELPADDFNSISFRDETLRDTSVPGELIDLTSSDDEGSYSCDDDDDYFAWLVSRGNPICQLGSPPSPITDSALFQHSVAKSPKSSIGYPILFKHIDGHLDQRDYNDIEHRANDMMHGPKQFWRLNSVNITPGNRLEEWMLNCGVISPDKSIRNSATKYYHPASCMAAEFVPDIIIID